MPYLVEHSRKKDREEMKLTAEEFDQRHGNLRKSLDTHMAMLKESIPFWEKFNTNITSISQWLDRVNGDLVSDKVQFGNAIVTEESLAFCQDLQQDINGHAHLVRGVENLGELLSKFVVAEDKEYVMEWVKRLAKGEEHVVRETEEKTELLEERLKSWRVSTVNNLVICTTGILVNPHSNILHITCHLYPPTQ